MALVTETLKRSMTFDLPDILWQDSLISEGQKEVVGSLHRVGELATIVNRSGESLLAKLGIDCIWVNSSGPNKQFSHAKNLAIIDPTFSGSENPVIGTSVEVDEIITVSTEALIRDKFEKVFKQISRSRLSEFGVDLRNGSILFSMSDVNGILADIGGGNHEVGSKKVPLDRPKQMDMTKIELMETIRSWLVDPEKGMGMSADLFMNPDVMLELRSDVANVFSLLSVRDNRLVSVDAVPIISEGYVHFPAIFLGSPIKLEQYLDLYLQVHGGLENPHYVAGGLHWPLFVQFMRRDPELGTKVSMQLVGERLLMTTAVVSGSEKRKKQSNSHFSLNERALAMLEAHVSGFNTIGMHKGLSKLASICRQTDNDKLIFSREPKSNSDIHVNWINPERIPPTATYS